jgi:hypothetical protein
MNYDLELLTPITDDTNGVEIRRQCIRAHCDLWVTVRYI